MKTGIVKFYNKEKGFGFIVGDDGKEIFVHTTGIREEIKQNDRVEYEEQEGKKGLNAAKVKRI
jgi:CspA family cold shock protein